MRAWSNKWFWCLKGNEDGIIKPVDRVGLEYEGEGRFQCNLSFWHGLLSKYYRLRNARGFGLECTEFEMLPSQDIEVEIFRRRGYTDQLVNKCLLIVICTPDAIL